MPKKFVIVIIILTIIKFLFNMDNEFTFVARVLCLVIAVLMFIISIVKVNNRELGILKLIGIGCLFIAIVRFIDIEIAYLTTNISVIFTLILVYLEFINIISSMIIYYNNYSKKVQWIILLLLTSIVHIIVRDELKGLKYASYFCESILGIGINLMIGVILFLIILGLYKKYNLGKKDRWIIEISSFMLLSNIFLLAMIYLNENFSYFIWVSKLISYFLLYNKFEKSLLYNAYVSAYESLNKVKEIKRNLNKSLKQRERELKELNLLLEKSEKKYLDVVKAFSEGLCYLKMIF